VAGPQGEFLYQSPSDATDRKVIDVDMRRSENVRRWWPFLRDRRIENYGGITQRFLD
jgi:N-carbamoylputrescine amidase